MAPEGTFVDLVDPRKVIEIGDEDPAAHDVGERRAGVGEDRLDVLEHHLDLDLDGVVDDAAVPEWDLTRHEDQAAPGDEPGDVGPAGGGVGEAGPGRSWLR